MMVATQKMILFFFMDLLFSKLVRIPRSFPRDIAKPSLKPHLNDHFLNRNDYKLTTGWQGKLTSQWS